MFFKDNQSREILSVVKNIGEEVAIYYSDLIPSLIINMIAFIMTITVLFILNYILSLIVLGLVIILFILTILVGKNLGKYNIETENNKNNNYGLFNEFTKIIES